jgi:hypothetical protein
MAYTRNRSFIVTKASSYQSLPPQTLRQFILFGEFINNSIKEVNKMANPAAKVRKNRSPRFSLEIPGDKSVKEMIVGKLNIVKEEMTRFLGTPVNTAEVLNKLFPVL